MQFFSLARVDTLRVTSAKNQIPEFKTNTTTRYGILYYHCHDDIKLLLCIVPVQSVMLEKIKNTKKTNQCLTIAEGRNGKISGKGCASSLNMRWVWIKKRRNLSQLMNVMTLQCLEFLNEPSVCTTQNLNQTGKVAMKQCNETDGQSIWRNSANIQAKLCSKWYYLRLKLEQNIEGYPAFSQRSDPDRWANKESEQQRIIQNKITYGGKYSMYGIKTSFTRNFH